jgi:competence protein ComEA
VQQPSSPRHERAYWLVLSALLNLTLSGLVVLFLRWPSPGAIRIETPAPAPTRQARIAVYVTGAVASPGVYDLPEDVLAGDALAAAGGAVAGADLAAVNLAMRLADGAHLHVPLVGEAPADPSTTPSLAKLDINSASAEALESLPGVGPSLAARIVAYRELSGPFSTVEELENVSGIGPATLAEILPHVTVR